MISVSWGKYNMFILRNCFKLGFFYISLQAKLLLLLLFSLNYCVFPLFLSLFFTFYNCEAQAAG